MSTDGLDPGTAERLLRDRQVLDIDQYGWWDENEIDPDFVGYAMWQLTPPYEPDFDAWQRNVRPNRAPSDKERRLMEWGNDFFGLMKTARHFIGQALEEQPNVQPLRIDPARFDFAEFAALASLVAAADRLRDFLIIAVLSSKDGSLEQLNNVYKRLNAEGLEDKATALRGLATPLNRNLRAARNASIHGLATRPAQVQRELISRDQHAFENHGYKSTEEPAETVEEMIRSGHAADLHEIEAVERRVSLLCEWYVGLVEIGGRNFEIEHEWRRSTGEPR